LHTISLTLRQCPVGRWPKDKKLKEIGSYGLTALVQDFEGFVLFMANLLGWEREKLVNDYIKPLREELFSGKAHAYYNQKVVWGRKPE
jgi:hypothetical protein